MPPLANLPVRMTVDNTDVAALQKQYVGKLVKATSTWNDHYSYVGIVTAIDSYNVILGHGRHPTETRIVITLKLRNGGRQHLWFDDSTYEVADG